MNLHNIKRSSMKTLVVMALIFAVISPGAGAEDGKTGSFSGYIKFERYHIDYEVNSDGTYSVTIDTLINVLTEQGVKSANHAGFSFSDSLDEAVILSACTLKQDGRRIDVPPSNIQEREAVAGGGPMFSDIKSKVLIFPEVAVGDKVGYSYKVNRKTALYPGHFSLTEAFTNFVAYDDVRVSVSVPSNSLNLQVFATGVQGGRIEDKDGRSRWVWTLQSQEIATPESGSVSPMDYGPRIVVSSFKDYGAIAAAYEERAKPKALATDKIRALAAELTAGVTDRKQQAGALYTWVVQNIRFAGNYMGIGSVVPHDADIVLTNRVGDCKDHTVLYQAMLAAVGIESTSVLINAGSCYNLPEAPSLRVLDHVITYIPCLDLYADPSSEYTPFGLLPLGVCGKPAIHTANFSIRKTPPTNYEGNQSSMKMVLHIYEDGSADGETNNEETGVMATAIRAAMTYIRPDLEDLFIRQMLENNGFTGTGTLIKADPRQLSDQYTYGMKYHITNALNLPGPGAMHIYPVFSSGRAIQGVVSGSNMPEPKLDFVCLGDILTEEYTIEFPKNVKIIALPKDVHLVGSLVRYDATYHQEGSTVSVVRRYEDRTPGPVCTPQDNIEFRPIARDIIKDLKTQLIYQPND